MRTLGLLACIALCWGCEDSTGPDLARTPLSYQFKQIRLTSMGSSFIEPSLSTRASTVVIRGGMTTPDSGWSLFPIVEVAGDSIFVQVRAESLSGGLDAPFDVIYDLEISGLPTARYRVRVIHDLSDSGMETETVHDGWIVVPR